MTDPWSEFAVFFEQRPLQLILGPRPGKKSVAALSPRGITLCCTLLGAREDVQPVRRICQKLECHWIWLPIEGGRLEVLGATNLVDHVRTLIDAIEQEPEPRIYIHCSAGIHRTGFFAYILLRLQGLCRREAEAELGRLRAVTAAQVGPDRLDLAEERLHGTKL